jgi:hypothetical protein
MKKGFLYLFLAGWVLLTAGCKKGNEGVENTSLQGLWELRSAYGQINTNYPPGNGNTLRFIGDIVETRFNSQLSTSKYTLVKDLSVESATCLVIKEGEFTNRIIYENMNADRKIFLQISGKKLSFLSGCFANDAGGEMNYEKID